MKLILKKPLIAVATGALVLSMAGCSNPQENPAKTAQEAVTRIMDGKVEEACDLMASSSDGPFVKGNEDHAACVYYMTSMKTTLEPYQGKKLTVNSASIDEDTAEVTEDDVNDDFKEFFVQNSLDLLLIDGEWFVELR